MTTINDDYSRANNGDLALAGNATEGWGWTGLAGQIQLYIGGAERNSAPGVDMIYRADADLASVNHQAQALVDIYGGGVWATRVGLILRKDASATLTFYTVELYWHYQNAPNNFMFIRKWVNGSPSDLASGNPGTLTPGTPKTLRGGVTGGAPTTIELYINDVLALTATDTVSPITSGLRTGLYGLLATDAGGPRWNSFTASDISSPGGAGVGRLIGGGLTSTGGLIASGRLIG